VGVTPYDAGVVKPRRFNVVRLARIVSPSAAQLLPALAFISLLAALLATRFQGVAGPWLWNLDMPKIDYPLASFYHEALTHGRLPLWNDNLGLGFPLYAEGQIGAFYPPNWLIFQLPPLVALDVSRILHLTIAGVGAGVLVLRIAGSRSGAILAAIVAVSGGAITAKLEWHNLVAAYAYAPWVMAPLTRRPAPSARGLVAAGVLFGVQALAAHPNTWLLTGITAAVIMIATRPRPATVGRILAFGLLGTAVGAVQLLPTAILTTLSVRSQALSPTDLFTSAATPFDILGLAFQGAFVRVDDAAWNPYTTWYPDGAFALYEAAVYVGLPTLALAAVGMTARRVRRLLIAALILVAIPIVAAFRPEPWLTTPILNALRSPTRAYLLLALLLGVVAGVGVARLGRAHRSLGRTFAVVAIPVAGYGLALALIRLAPGTFDELLLASSSFLGRDRVADQRQLALTALTAVWPLALDVVAGLASVLLIAVAARFRRSRIVLAPAAVLVATVPLAILGPLPNSTRPLASFSYADTDFVRAAVAADPYRLLTLNPPGFYAGTPDQLAAAGVPDLRMFSSLNLAASEAITRQASMDEATNLRSALGVDTIVTFDRPCDGQQIASVPSEKAAICHVVGPRPPYWIPSSAVRLTATEASPIRPQDAEIDVTSISQAAPAESAARDDTRLEATVDAPGPGWIWIDRAWWPAWHTTIDGSTTPVVRALGGQLLPVQAGRHVVSQRLLPWDALVGLVLGVAALAIAGVALGGSKAIRLAGWPGEAS
jgi:hypothetical protein